LELIEVESLFIDEVFDLRANNLVVVERAPENEGFSWIVH
jgi:hypothetical protein